MFNKSIDARIRIVLVAFSFLFLLIVFRVFYIQVFQYKKLNELALNLWSRELPIEADRGRILDRNGVVLADNLTTTSLILVPNQITNKEDTCKKLSEILGVSYDEMKEHVFKKTSIERVHPEGRRLDYDVANEIEKLKIEGVYLVREAKRYYPNDDLLAHSIGYVGIDNQGLAGIELQYDKYLTGVNGAIKYFSDAKGNTLNLSEVYIEPVAGDDVYLTIDFEIQQSIERELDNINDMFDADSALAIVVNPKTGEILGMGSTPSFDPNNYQDYPLDTLSRNLPIWSSYEPGSTFKIMTMAAAVDTKIIDIFNDTFYDGGSVIVDGQRLGCWKAGGHGNQTFLQVLENSCNPGFVELGMRLGTETLFKYIHAFGFGGKTGVDLSGEGTGILFDLNDIGNVELATSAFGQGVSVTAIQQVMATAAVVNGGYLNKPYILDKIVKVDSEDVLLEKKPSFIRKVISSETSSIMRSALESVVANGGGKAAYIDGYRIGGKTGTAQKAVNGSYLVGNYIMSFMAVLPGNNPEAILYLAIDNPKNTALLSSYTTTPIARRILLDIIEALDIEKSSEGLPKASEWTDAITYVVPNVIGLSVDEAKKLLAPFEIEYSGSGTTIFEQSPIAGDVVEEKSIVKVMLK